MNAFVFTDTFTLLLMQIKLNWIIQNITHPGATRIECDQYIYKRSTIDSKGIISLPIDLVHISILMRLFSQFQVNRLNRSYDSHFDLTSFKRSQRIFAPFQFEKNMSANWTMNISSLLWTHQLLYSTLLAFRCPKTE